ncbi:MAG: PIN domain-containing protein [Kovacikia sp.]
MAVIPPFLLLFDSSALMGGATREWHEFSRIGECFVPKVILEEINFLTERASEPTQEQTAREFVRFYPESGWKSVSSIATHPSLKPAEGHALSKRARLTLTLLQSAYGLARNRPDGLVVIVSSDQGLMQRVRVLETPNLCAIPVVALVQWSRSERKPPVVIHQLQVMRSAVGVAASKPTGAGPLTQPKAAVAHQNETRRSTRPAFRLPIAKIFYNMLTVAIVALAVLALWRVVFPASFEQFWQQIHQLNQSSPLEKPVPKKR